MGVFESALQGSGMPGKNADAVVAGHICVDITPQFGAVKVEQVLIPGSLIDMGPATVSSSGSVSNTGLALRRLGADVTLMGKCG